MHKLYNKQPKKKKHLLCGYTKRDREENRIGILSTGMGFCEQNHCEGN